MSSPFIAEIKIFSFAFAPRGWAFCNGQLLPINQYPAVFYLLGTTYGGDGRINFALPNLQGSVPIHAGNDFTLGEMGGAASHTLTLSEMPAHTHTVNASSANANQASPINNFWAVSSAYTAYSNQAVDTAMAPTITNAGGAQSHENRSPYLTLNFCIALTGIFPSQS